MNNNIIVINKREREDGRGRIREANIMIMMGVLN